MEGGEVGGGGEVCEELKGFKVGEKVGGAAAAAAAAVEEKVGPGDKKGETAAAAAAPKSRGD